MVMPELFTGIGSQRYDRCEVEIVAARRAAQIAIPWRAVAGADVHKIEIGIVGDGIPWRAAAAIDPPFAGRIPGFGRRLHLASSNGFDGSPGTANQRHA